MCTVMFCVNLLTYLAVCSCDSDAGGVQVGANTKASSEGEALDDPAVHTQAAQDADQVPRPSVAQEQHEDNVGNLPESPAPTHR